MKWSSIGYSFRRLKHGSQPWLKQKYTTWSLTSLNWIYYIDITSMIHNIQIFNPFLKQHYKLQQHTFVICTLKGTVHPKHENSGIVNVVPNMYYYLLKKYDMRESELLWNIHFWMYHPISSFYTVDRWCWLVSLVSLPLLFSRFFKKNSPKKWNNMFKQILLQYV